MRHQSMLLTVKNKTLSTLFKGLIVFLCFSCGHSPSQQLSKESSLKQNDAQPKDDW